MIRRGLILPLMLCVVLSSHPASAEPDERASEPTIRVGSKAFTEGVILGEIVTQLAEQTGAEVRHRDQLGSTAVLWQALRSGEIDVYVEYTGTLLQEIFSQTSIRTRDELRRALAEQGIAMSGPLGFENTYCLGMKDSTAERLGIRTISDLRNHPELTLGFSNEFMDRADGWPGLQRAYRLPHRNVRGLQHELAYRGLESGAIDVTDLYSTDAEIRYYGLRVLQDDLGFFPDYSAVLLYREELETRAPEVVQSLKQLEGAISQQAMIGMNARAQLDGVHERVVAAEFLERTFGIRSRVSVRSRAERLWQYTLEHLYLVSISMAAAVVIAVPLGIVAAKHRATGQLSLGTVGVVQTIPALALFVLLIPVLGLGTALAICVLTLYSVLPILRNTYTALQEIPPGIHESARALGLPAGARLRLVELPLAARSILAGIKTATVLNIGWAAFGGFIGAGGYGDPIFSGLRHPGRTDLILEGAVPAALMALLAQGLFEIVERFVVPKGLRLTSDH